MLIDLLIRTVVIIIPVMAGIAWFVEYKTNRAIQSKKDRDKNEFIENLKNKDTASFLRYSLTQIEDYYIINKNQARNAYWASVTISFLGFLVILIVAFGWTQKINDLSVGVPLSGVISGILLEFIAFSFLNVYRVTLQQLNSYFVQLGRVQELSLSLDLVEQVETDSKRESCREKIISMLLNSYINPISLKTPELEKKLRQRENEDEDKLGEGERNT